MKNIKFIYCCIFFLILSCGQGQNKVEVIKGYYTDGSLKESCEKRNGKLHGECKSYYPNGPLMVIAYYKNGLKDSMQCVYSESGKLENKSFYKKGMSYGNAYSYNKLERVDTLLKFIIKDDSAYLNQVICYTDDGHIDTDRSNYFSITKSKDTLEYGEDFNVDVKLEASLFNMNMLVIFGDFDKDYKTWTYADTIWDREDKLVDFKINYSTKKYKKGKNTLRGIVHDFISYYENDTSKNILHDIREMYFEVDFFVKD